MAAIHVRKTAENKILSNFYGTNMARLLHLHLMCNCVRSPQQTVTTFIRWVIFFFCLLPTIKEKNIELVCVHAFGVEAIEVEVNFNRP